MMFVAKATLESDFEDWVARVKRSPLKLTESVYNELEKPSIKSPVLLLFPSGKRTFFIR